MGGETDGPTALRSAIDTAYGADNPIQCCQLAKERIVLDCLTNEQKEYALLSADGFLQEAEKGRKRLMKLSEQYEKSYPCASGSTGAGVAETFTMNRLGMNKSLVKRIKLPVTAVYTIVPPPNLLLDLGQPLIGQGYEHRGRI